ncbi:MAG: uracil-DNA glycosylase [Phenylobacterium sp. RIFCSPHIGHO2_01_FULL_69_31]|uniref:uracil-DNA glycosylase n=1 Tax=Phenylobacterium sp. RIFCSPHIGHO2_01_FULL_69_31 TaxID=1801944 RepID=UPI0008B7666B|nr:uracil-DNA glycosylase [Phenylobacterium sp. RIFCSPHIGHO2_01_FULL_69_31]OHB30381.1 MAG: uracil-DNA glycosylase [Phenylobacterium sp. RIFCSPHIGHO2_01_FULL_69_31]
MSAIAEPFDAAIAESLLAFWADAGVDAMLLDEAVDRIEAGKILPPARPAAPVVPLAAAPAPRAFGGQADISGAVAQAQQLAAGAANLDALVAAIAAFEGCPLRFEGAATKAVVYRGDPKAPLLVIGEGPGADEDARGEPFVGRAGKLLDRMLAAAGLTDRVLITNTVFWRPPGNRTPTPAEQAICAPFLERIVQLVQPRMLLLAGGASAKSVLKREEGILSLRGRWFEWRSADGTLELPAMPTLHPAFLLRQPGAKKKAWSDLLTLSERLDRPERPL